MEENLRNLKAQTPSGGSQHVTYAQDVIANRKRSRALTDMEDKDLKQGIYNAENITKLSFSNEEDSTFVKAFKEEEDAGAAAEHDTNRAAIMEESYEPSQEDILLAQENAKEVFRTGKDEVPVNINVPLTNALNNPVVGEARADATGEELRFGQGYRTLEDSTEPELNKKGEEFYRKGALHYMRKDQDNFMRPDVRLQAKKFKFTQARQSDIDAAAQDPNHVWKGPKPGEVRYIIREVTTPPNRSLLTYGDDAVI